METLYYWTGRIVIDGALILTALTAVYFAVGFAGAFYGIALRKYDWLNYRHYFAIKLFKTFVLRKDWLRKGSPQEFAGWLRGFNERTNKRANDIRAKAPFYRWLFAYIIRRNRRKWAASWA